jgi:hypothetical protein
MTPVLFARQDSIYKQLGCDVYDIDRDARNFPGGKAGVYHPPCRGWGQLEHFAKPRPDEKELAVWSVAQIRKYGGVLEHPRGSKLWKHLDLPTGNKTDEYGGYSLSVNQSWWDHRAEKKTLLYIVGCERSELPQMPLKFDAIEYVVAPSKNNHGKGIKSITKKEREQTPVEFAKWLIEIVQKINQAKNLPKAG